jgi:hypothetical protein
MTSQEYTQWLKGFLDAVDGYNITKRQFDSIREKLKEVTDEPVGVPIGNGGIGVPTWWGGPTQPSTTPYSIPLSGTGTITSGNTITTTQFPKGSTVTYTDTSGNSSTYTIPNTTNNIFTNQNSKDDEKLLMD